MSDWWSREVAKWDQRLREAQATAPAQAQAPRVPTYQPPQQPAYRTPAQQWGWSGPGQQVQQQQPPPNISPLRARLLGTPYAPPTGQVPGLPALPPGAPQYRPDITRARDEIYRAMAQQVIPDWMQDPERYMSWAPRWMQQAAEFMGRATQDAAIRVGGAYQRPEERAASTAPPSERVPLWDPRVGMRAGQEALGELPTWLRSGLQTTGLTGAYANIRAVPANWQQATQAWERITAEHKAPRRLEQLGAAGMEALQEGAVMLEQGVGAGLILGNKRSRSLQVEDWYALTPVTWSLAYRQGEAAKRAYEQYKPTMKGPLAEQAATLKGWMYPERDVLGESLRAIESGRASAEEIAEAEYHFGAEFVGQMLADPLNVLDFATAAAAIGKARQLTRAQQRMAQNIADHPKLKQALDTLVAGLQRTADEELDALQEAARAKDLGETGGFWAKLKSEWNPFDLTPAAKAERDAGETWLALAGPLTAVKTPEEAAELLTTWARQPEALAEILGNVPMSLAGQKASAILADVGDALKNLPSMQEPAFNPAKFLVELDDLMIPRLRQAYGYKDPGRVGKFINAYKGLMSEFYLTAIYSPGYALRNTASDMFTMAVDGLLTFESNDNIVKWFDDLGGIPSRRITTGGKGIREELTGIPEAGTRLPGLAGEFSKKGQEIVRHGEPFGRLPIGEEPRYRRAFYKAAKKFFDENALKLTPELQEATRARLGLLADDLRVAAARAMTPDAKRAAVERILDAVSPAQAIEPAKYLSPEQLDALSPELYSDLVARLQALPAEATSDDVAKTFDDVRALVAEDEARRLKDIEQTPRITVRTNADEQELADELVTEIEEAVSKVQDPQVRARLEEDLERLKEEIPRVQAEIDRARGELVEAIKEEAGADSLDVLLAANRDSELLRDETRKTLNELRVNATREYQDLVRPGDEIWPEYFTDSSKGWNDLATQRISRYDQARDQLVRIRAGESADDVLGFSRHELAELRMRQASTVDIPEAPKGYMPGKVIDATENDKFEAFLWARRRTEDAAQANAWRAAYGADPQQFGHVVDALDSAGRDVELWGKATAGRVRDELQKTMRRAEKSYRRTFKATKGSYQQKQAAAKLAASVEWEKYYVIRHDLWSKLHDSTIARWKIAERDILVENWKRGPRMEPPTKPLTTTEPAAAVTTPGDLEIVKRAALKDEALWTAEEKQAVARWTRQGNAVPQVEQPLLPTTQDYPNPYTRERFREDLIAKVGLSEKEANTTLAVADARAKVWAAWTGRDPSEWYATRIAGIEGPGPVLPKDLLYQAAPSISDMSGAEVIAQLEAAGGLRLSAAQMAEILGQQTPEYLKPIVRYMLDQRAKLIDGKLTPRDVAKAMVLNSSSQRGQEISLAAFTKGLKRVKVDPFPIPENFILTKLGTPYLRPEDAMGAWLLSPNGRRALDLLEQGTFDAKLWDEAGRLRKVWGIDPLGIHGVTTQKKSLGLHRIQELTDKINELGPTMRGGPSAEMDALMMQVAGVGQGKLGFYKHLLGMGDTPTIDAIEINAWLTGKGWAKGPKDIDRLANRVKELRTTMSWATDRIGQQFDELGALGVANDIDPQLRNHILHHWIWDTFKGTTTDHQAMYDAMRFAQVAQPRLPGLGPTQLDAIQMRYDRAGRQIAEMLDALGAGPDIQQEAAAAIRAGQFTSPHITQMFGPPPYLRGAELTDEQAAAWAAIRELRDSFDDLQRAQAQAISGLRPPGPQTYPAPSPAARRTGQQERRLAQLRKQGSLTADELQEFKRLQTLSRFNEGSFFQTGAQVPAPRWYYQAERVLTDKMPNRANVDQVKAILTKGGVKQDELEWSGVLRWLDEQKGTLSKEDVLGYLQENRIQVQEVVKGGDPADLRAQRWSDLEGELQERGYRVEWEPTGGPDDDYRPAYIVGPEGETWQSNELDRLYQQDQAAALRAREMFDIEGTDWTQRTRYQQYTEPGGKDYTELLLTLPPETPPPGAMRGDELEALRRQIDEINDRIGLGKYDNLQDIQLERAQLENKLWDQRTGYYTHGHWEEENVLAHVRFKEREGPNGERVLFLEEIQSDWHQRGRKVGYRDPRAKARVRAVEDKLKRKGEFYADRLGTPSQPLSHWFGYEGLGPTHAFVLEDPHWMNGQIHVILREKLDSGQYYENWAAYFETYDEVAEYLGDDFAQLARKNANHDLRGEHYMEIPDDWSLRRLYEQGTSGQVPPAPFAKSWDELTLKRMYRWAAENGYDQIAWTTGKTQADRYKLTKVVDKLEYNSGTKRLYGYKDGERIFTQEGVSPKELPDHIGKEGAQKLLDAKQWDNELGGASYMLQGEALEVGGQGMAGFYDRILPYSSNKLTKRWGVKVEPLDVQTYASRASRDSYYQGLQVFERSDGRGFFVKSSTGAQPANEVFPTREAAQRWIDNLGADRPEFAQAHGIAISPQMRRDLLGEGLPLFQGARKGAVQFLDDGRAVIHAFEAADVSTVVHELGHIFRRELDAKELDLISRWVEKEAQRLNVLAAQGKIEQRLRNRIFVGQDGSSVDVVQGINADRSLTRAGEEMFSSAFERYLAEGDAPTPELQTIFERFKDWLKAIYQNLTGTEVDVKLNDNVRGVFDRLLDEDPPVRPGDVAGQERLFVAQSEAAEAIAKARRAREPLSVDEAAELFGTGEDWDGLADKLWKEHLRARELSDPAGLDNMAHMWSHKGEKKPIEVGGYFTESNRVKSVKAEAEYRRSLMGPLRHDPKEFYRRQRDLAQWYHSLWSDAQRKAQGLPVKPRTPPEWLAKESIEALEQLQQLEQGGGIARKIIDGEEWAVDAAGNKLFQQGAEAAGPQSWAWDAARILEAQSPNARLTEGTISQLQARMREAFDAGELTRQEWTRINRIVFQKGRRPTAAEVQQAIIQPHGPPQFGAPKGPQQVGMFDETYEDLPLVSGVGASGQVGRFAPPTAGAQTRLPGMDLEIGEAAKYAAKPAGEAAPQVDELAALRPPEEMIPPGQQTLFQTGDAEEAPAFRKWFGRSWVVDEKGKPKRMYHGTPSAGFTEFDPRLADQRSLMGPGLYFTDDPALASSYAKEGPSPGVYAVYLSVQNPLNGEGSLNLNQAYSLINLLPEQSKARAAQRIKYLGMTADPWASYMVPTTSVLDILKESTKTQDEFSAILKRAGYDGIYYQGGARVGDVQHEAWVVFDSNQIKSVWNPGEWGPGGGILEQRGIHPTLWELYQDEAATAGATHGPSAADAVQVGTRATNEALDTMQTGMVGDWAKWQPQVVDQATRAEVMNWLNKQVIPSWHETRAVGMDYARAQADGALLDYSNRRNFDTWLNTVFPYHFWFTRSGANWAKRLAQRPGMVAGYLRTRDAMKRANEQAGRRQRFESKIRVPFPWLPEWAGDALYVDPLRFVLPFANLYGTNWDDADDGAKGLQRLFGLAQQAGFRPYHFWELPYQAGWFAKAGEALGMEPEKAQQYLGPKYPGGMGNLLPQSGALKAATAGLRELGVEAIPPGGINIESPFRRLLGLPAGDVWDPYRVNRMLANIATEDPTNPQLARLALMAQELVARDEDQAGQVWSPGSQIAQQVAQEMNWSPEELGQAQQLLALALQRASLERGVGAVGWALGPSMTIEPEGERRQMELQRLAQQQAWSPNQPGGSRQAYQDLKAAAPAIYPRITQYNVLPGEQGGQGMAPGARANWLAAKQEKDRIHEEINRQVDDLLRREPWNWAGRSKLEDQRRAQLAAIDEQYPLPPMTGKLPPILYGMNPAEMWDSSAEAEIRTLEEGKPSPDTFQTKDGQVDWGSYYDAVDQWKATLPRQFAFGQVQGGKYQGMDPATALTNYDQRYDSPLEAAYKTYQEQVAGPAWDAYNARKGQKGAFANTVGQVGPVPAAALIPAIVQQYQTQGWTPEQLQQELAGVTFPALKDWKALKAGQVGTAQPPQGPGAYTSDKKGWWNDPDEYASMAEKVNTQGWRAVYGVPWWEKYSRGGGGGGGGSKKKGGPGPTSGSYPSGSRWRPPRYMRGGPWQF